MVLRKKVAPEIISTSILLFLMVITLSHLRGVQLNWRGENRTIDYWVLRAELIQEEENRQLGGDLKFHRDERLANQVLMEAKQREIDDGFDDPTKFLPAQNFLLVVDKIHQSKVFQLIQHMPKGAVLHTHDTAIVSYPWVFQNVTYRPNLYICEDDNGGVQARFFEKPDNTCQWQLLSEVRKTDASINSRISRVMTMVCDSPEKAYPDVDAAWKKFMDIFIFITPMLTHRPVYEDHFYQGLQELYDDNIMYLELRTTLPELYDLDGKVYGHLEVAKIYKNVSDRFVKDHPDFIGVKIIYAPLRKVSEKTIGEYLETARHLLEELPGFVAGFDLVGQEDKGEPLINFANQIDALNFPVNLFLHAGETKWSGSSTDQNLIDAVLLRAKRIGHGFALPKHPRIMELIKERGVAIEVNPISNQVLRLVDDMRNHPSSVLFAQNYPVVVSNDDPGLWGAKGLSYDFYEAFVGIMSKSADIRSLKVLAKNSIEYSSMDSDEKARALAIWRRKWDEYVDKLIKS